MLLQVHVLMAMTLVQHDAKPSAEATVEQNVMVAQQELEIAFAVGAVVEHTAGDDVAGFVAAVAGLETVDDAPAQYLTALAYQ